MDLSAPGPGNGPVPGRLRQFRKSGELSCGISAYGVYAFLRHHIADYLFLRSHFVFFDYEQPPVLYFLDLLAMMGLWIALPYYLGKALRNRAGRTSHQSQIWEEDIP